MKTFYCCILKKCSYYSTSEAYKDPIRKQIPCNKTIKLIGEKILKKEDLASKELALLKL